MAISIIDASIAFKWFLDEDGSDAARVLGASNEELIAPDLLRVELHHALMFAVRGGRFDRAVAMRANESLTMRIARFVSISPMIADAARLSWDHNLPIYDCLYIVLALRENATLVTADERQFEIARRARCKISRL